MNSNFLISTINKINRYVPLSTRTPFISPFPLIILIILFLTEFLNCFRKISPILNEFSDSFSSSKISKAVKATLLPKGFPPKVEPCVPKFYLLNFPDMTSRIEKKIVPYSITNYLE